MVHFVNRKALVNGFVSASLALVLSLAKTLLGATIQS